MLNNIYDTSYLIHVSPHIDPEQIMALDLLNNQLLVTVAAQQFYDNKCTIVGTEKTATVPHGTVH